MKTCFCVIGQKYPAPICPNVTMLALVVGVKFKVINTISYWEAEFSVSLSVRSTNFAQHNVNSSIEILKDKCILLHRNNGVIFELHTSETVVALTLDFPLNFDTLCLFTAKEMSHTTNEMSRIVTKPTKWRVRPAKTQISLGIRPV